MLVLSTRFDEDKCGWRIHEASNTFVFRAPTVSGLALSCGSVTVLSDFMTVSFGSATESSNSLIRVFLAHFRSIHPNKEKGLTLNMCHDEFFFSFASLWNISNLLSFLDKAHSLDDFHHTSSFVYGTHNMQSGVVFVGLLLLFYSCLDGSHLHRHSMVVHRDCFLLLRPPGFASLMQSSQLSWKIARGKMREMKRTGNISMLVAESCSDHWNVKNHSFWQCEGEEVEFYCQIE